MTDENKNPGEDLLGELKKEYDEASEEEKERGRQVAAKYAFSRLSYNQRNRLQHG